MSDRISYPGVEHGDTVRLTGVSWPPYLRGRELPVDDESHHRPVVTTTEGGERVLWYLFPEQDTYDFSVTKVAS